MSELELHPLCTLFPRMAGAEFDALVADIKASGLRQPIVLHEDMILDGGNRYRACIEAEVDPEFIEFQGGDPISFVLSVNFHRRHLSAGQQAAVVASAQDWAKAQPHGGNRIKWQPLPLDTVADRTALSGASNKTQRNADKVAKADPELAKQVALGEISLPEAVKKITGKSKPKGKSKSKKPSPPQLPDDETKELHARIDELSATAKELLEENTSMGAVLDADDKLAALTAENKKLRELNRVLNERIQGLQGECNEAKRAAKMWRSKYDRLEKLAA